MNVIHFWSAVARIKNRREKEKYKRIAAKLTCPELKCEPGRMCELCRGCKGA